MDLVKMRGKNAVCDSLDVAEHFGKRHDNVIRLIDNLLKIEGVKQTFVVSKYVDSKGEQRKRYYMNRDGFSLLVMGFTGKEAIEWKLKYIEAFNRMEQLLAQKQTEVYKDTRAYQKAIRKQETDTIKALVDYAKSQGSKNAVRYYSSLSKLADKTVGISDREQATIKQLGALSMAENIIDKAIVDGMATQKYYRDIYKECKQRLEQFQAMTLIETEN